VERLLQACGDQRGPLHADVEARRLHADDADAGRGVFDPIMGYRRLASVFAAEMSRMAIDSISEVMMPARPLVQARGDERGQLQADVEARGLHADGGNAGRRGVYVIGTARGVSLSACRRLNGPLSKLEQRQKSGPAKLHYGQPLRANFAHGVTPDAG
jgi:hypothetical protein